jgi:hypothetical protein
LNIKQLTDKQKEELILLRSIVGVHGGRSKVCKLGRVRLVVFTDLVPAVERLEYLFLKELVKNAG